MKVVLFCGGMGMRIRDLSEALPKPLVNIGSRPILWNLMSYYAHYGHKDFVLCLGYRADAIKNYFLEYDECMSNDFILSRGGRNLRLLNRDIDEWTITFVDTGRHANIGMRLAAVREHLEGEEMFMANYADALTDLDLADHLERFRRQDKIASMVTVPPPHAFHIIKAAADGEVKEIEHVGESDVRINAGFFIFRNAIFDYMREGEELVIEPFQRLIEAGQLSSYAYDGFWQNMDTFKDHQRFEQMLHDGDTPWQVWKSR
jgi:glucose-1-phosphate cytidylyltransferase